MCTLFSRISEYSTAQSPEAAYIIGGTYTKNLVAEFKNDQWLDSNFIPRNSKKFEYSNFDSIIRIYIKNESETMKHEVP